MSSHCEQVLVEIQQNVSCCYQLDAIFKKHQLLKSIFIINIFDYVFLLNFETETKSHVALTQKCNKHLLPLTEQQQRQFCQASVPCLLYTATTKIYTAHISACNSSHYQLSTNTTKPICRLCYFHTFSPPFTENSCLPGILAAIKITGDENQISSYSKKWSFQGEKQPHGSSAQPPGITNCASNKIQGCFVFMSDKADKT